MITAIANHNARKGLSIQLFIFIFVTAGTCGFGQQMVQTVKDLPVISQNNQQFIDKPLSDLLKEIKPQIKLVLAEGGWVERAPHFIFFFTAKDLYDKYRRLDKFPARITVFIKETFKWPTEGRNRSKEHYLDWAKEDEEKYGHLTIIAIRVTADDNICDNESMQNL